MRISKSIRESWFLRLPYKFIQLGSPVMKFSVAFFFAEAPTKMHRTCKVENACHPTMQIVWYMLFHMHIAWKVCFYHSTEDIACVFNTWLFDSMLSEYAKWFAIGTNTLLHLCWFFIGVSTKFIFMDFAIHILNYCYQAHVRFW